MTLKIASAPSVRTIISNSLLLDKQPTRFEAPAVLFSLQTQISNAFISAAVLLTDIQKLNSKILEQLIL
jgi:hypothetical protein